MYRKTKRYIQWVSAIALSVNIAVKAEDITEQIERALKAYHEHSYARSLRELQFATAQIQEKLNNSYLALMPEPLAGWQADQPEAQTAVALMGGGTHISRHYHFDQAQEITLEIIIDSPLIQMLTLTMSNIPVLTTDQSMKPYRFEIYRGTVNKESNTREISLLVDNQIMVKATGQNLKEEKTLESYLRAMDLKKIALLFEK